MRQERFRPVVRQPDTNCNQFPFQKQPQARSLSCKLNIELILESNWHNTREVQCLCARGGVEMADKGKLSPGQNVSYLYAAAIDKEHKLDTIEALAAGGIALISQRTAAALETTRRNLAAIAPDGVTLWLEGFMKSLCVIIMDELTTLLSDYAHLLNSYTVSELMDELYNGFRCMVIELTESIDSDFVNLLRGLYDSLVKSTRQVQRIDSLMGCICSLGLREINPLLHEATTQFKPHRTILTMLGLSKKQVESRCSAEWNAVLTGLLAHISRRLTSEMSVMWTRHLYACHDRSLLDTTPVLNRYNSIRLFA